MARARRPLKCSKVVRDEDWDTQNRPPAVAGLASDGGTGTMSSALEPLHRMALRVFVTKEGQCYE
jgi:hypothetical protein